MPSRQALGRAHNEQTCCNYHPEPGLRSGRFCPEIERGEVNLVKTTGLHAAGKGINVAKVLKDLGIDVTVGGFLGKDNGMVSAIVQ